MTKNHWKRNGRQPPAHPKTGIKDDPGGRGATTHQDDLPPQQRRVERRYLPGLAVVVVGQADEEHDADAEHQHGNRHGDHNDHPGGRHHGLLGGAGAGEPGQDRAPEPEHDNVDLLGALDPAGAVNPCLDGGAACETSSISHAARYRRGGEGKRIKY
jgi:hypothetical protein